MTAAALAAPVAALVQRCGMPLRVASENDGNHVTFADHGATVDALIDADGAIVRALDVRAQSPATIDVAVDGVMRTLPFGDYELARADADLASVADRAFGSERAYGLAAQRELLLAFDPATKRLARVVIGARPALERLALLPAPIDRRPFTYLAPVVKHTNVRDGGGAHATIVRVDVDRYGVVRNVTIVVPSVTDAFDAALAAKLGDDIYVPAQLAGRPVAASVFREVQP